MSSPILPPPSGNLTSEMRGVWWLLSREDCTKDGQQRIDPALGADPIAILTYAPNHFAAQFMKRNRSGNPADQIFYSAKNNTSAVGGYDAYFGTYKVNEQTGEVAHTLIGSLSPSNIGNTTLRNLRVIDDKLMLQLETTTPEGEPIIRTIIWKRIN
ncbi:MAG TPA: lipocalin-like domain-containing protein [Chitinophagaceae bacterium]|nr:lipocalin-like domain-containing protein [Chitinophagaceae bacterium]